jgi:uncharacterized SAM-binding protein YcdF (DUF218 family)
VTRLVAVLGYSDGSTAELHRVCAARLERAERSARPDDVVLLSGWARNGSSAPEADLMARAWRAPVRARVVDRHARTTLGNVMGIARLARKLDADEVVLVTSSWHARRASTLLRAALAGSGASARTATTDEQVTPFRRVRELASWAIVPLLAFVAARTR